MVKVVSTARRADAVRRIGCGILMARSIKTETGC